MVEKIKSNKLLLQIIKFVIVGGIATVIDFIFLYIFKEFVGLHELVANRLRTSIIIAFCSLFV